MAIPDLITSSFAQQAIAAAGMTPNTAQSTHLASAISAASQSVGNWCGGRDFVRKTYTEDYRAELDGRVLLNQYPVNRVLRIAAERTAAISITANIATVQRATILFSTTGDVDAGQVVTGVEIDWVTNGVPGSTTLLYTTYPTIGALATAIGGIAGITAIVSPTFSSWLSTELLGGEVAQGCLQGASLDVYSTDLSGARIDQQTGMLAVGFAGIRGSFGPRWGPDWPDMDDDILATSSRVRVVYDAGYAVVPLAVQQAVAEVVLLMFRRLITDPTLLSERGRDYSYQQAADSAIGLISDATMTALSLYRRRVA